MVKVWFLKFFLLLYLCGVQYSCVRNAAHLLADYCFYQYFEKNSIVVTFDHTVKHCALFVFHKYLSLNVEHSLLPLICILCNAIHSTLHCLCLPTGLCAGSADWMIPSQSTELPCHFSYNKIMWSFFFFFLV